VMRVGALFALLGILQFLARRIVRSIGRSNRLGTASRQWLHVHRAEDQ